MGINIWSTSVVVYGADVICASCVNAPTSKDIYDWLQPLLKENTQIYHLNIRI